MLHLSRKGLIHKAKVALEHGAPRSAAILTMSSGVGILAGKRGDVKKVPLGAAAAGVGLNLLGFHTLGDGALAGAATLIGYRQGAKRKALTSGPAAPAKRK